MNIHLYIMWYTSTLRSLVGQPEIWHVKLNFTIGMIPDSLLPWESLAHKTNIIYALNISQMVATSNGFTHNSELYT